MDITEIKRLLPWSVKQRPEVQAVLVKAEQAEQGWATASSACNRVADERDRLKAELTTAKEEIERLFQDAVQTQRHADSLLEKLHAAESALERERKETERLREALRQIETARHGEYETRCHGIAKAALKPA
jgi:chromosome segregation ATPase